jgi:cytoskeletal protein RodZ
MKDRVIEIPQRLIIAIVSLFVVIVLIVAILLIINNMGIQKEVQPTEELLDTTQTVEAESKEYEAIISDLAAAIARDIADGTAYENPQSYTATEAFVSFLEKIANDMRESGIEPSTSFIRYEGEPVITRMNVEVADISVHVVYRDTAMASDTFYLAEIEVHLVNDGIWKIDSVSIQQKGGINP